MLIFKWSKTIWVIAIKIDSLIIIQNRLLFYTNCITIYDVYIDKYSLFDIDDVIIKYKITLPTSTQKVVYWLNIGIDNDIDILVLHGDVHWCKISPN